MLDVCINSLLSFHNKVKAEATLSLLIYLTYFTLFIYLFIYFFFWHFEGWIWIRNIWLFEREKWGFSIRSHVCMQVLVKSEASFWSITRPLFYKILYENCWSLNSQCLLSQVPDAFFKASYQCITLYIASVGIFVPSDVWNRMFMS